ncbi:MAG: hypothetical protein FWF81_01440 [Defluviitaleaceae bacterium]|nr:hypothetical protein [Defluviitaleaceae bacterium]
METLEMQINNMVTQLNQPEQVLVLEIVKRFLPDDVASENDLIAISAARREYRDKETISENDINWD